MLLELPCLQAWSFLCLSWAPVGWLVVGGRGRWREGEQRAQTLPGVAGRCNECQAKEQPELFL